MSKHKERQFQIKIVQHLVSKSIDLLKEKRTALISAVVTGKVDV